MFGIFRTGDTGSLETCANAKASPPGFAAMPAKSRAPAKERENSLQERLTRPAAAPALLKPPAP
jgi:hypothetical protein